jgi:hypothetical protein
MRSREQVVRAGERLGRIEIFLLEDRPVRVAERVGTSMSVPLPIWSWMVCRSNDAPVSANACSQARTCMSLLSTSVPSMS